MNDSNDLRVRMNRLERQHRRLRLFFTGALVLLGVLLVSGQARPQAKPKSASPVLGTKEEPLRRVVAQEFVLVDGQGHEGGRWGFKENHPEFRMFVEFSIVVFDKDGLKVFEAPKKDQP